MWGHYRNLGSWNPVGCHFQKLASHLLGHISQHVYFAATDEAHEGELRLGLPASAGLVVHVHQFIVPCAEYAVLGLETCNNDVLLIS